MATSPMRSRHESKLEEELPTIQRYDVLALPAITDTRLRQHIQTEGICLYSA
jgi:hypothetical protein